MGIYILFKITGTGRHYQVAILYGESIDDVKKEVSERFRKDRRYVIVNINNFEEAS